MAPSTDCAVVHTECDLHHECDHLLYKTPPLVESNGRCTLVSAFVLVDSFFEGCALFGDLCIPCSACVPDELIDGVYLGIWVDNQATVDVLVIRVALLHDHSGKWSAFIRRYYGSRFPVVRTGFCIGSSFGFCCDRWNECAVVFLLVESLNDIDRHFGYGESRENDAVADDEEQGTVDEPNTESWVSKVTKETVATTTAALVLVVVVHHGFLGQSQAAAVVGLRPWAMAAVVHCGMEEGGEGGKGYG